MALAQWRVCLDKPAWSNAGVGGAMLQGASGTTDGVSLRIGIGASSPGSRQTCHDKIGGG
ncbi:hypothetical protein GGD72_003007 [Stenotrophomonas maltophilia]|uniref:hypothetical protein n=1 Tax=Stenotrophomonas maltophilia TaxID=40324 RepID=UPI001311B23D|nr:hypothetical protein [Stenotrophomonas maltophilia]MBB5532201.1 hypothetical protein [Stenotrophomonas maltophilia]MCD5965805.1 hypothetical protein [Stenotrophomonas maltophilia]MDZ5787806.1 hypothetical protein [Stenotrophomonas maltophilia]HDS1555553.1 hypothetical protein [Stenotrophomonas maltophilia]